MNEIHVMDGRSRIARVQVYGGTWTGSTADPVLYNLEEEACRSSFLGHSSFTLTDIGGAYSQEEYFPFGETSFGSYAKKRYRFCGKERDEESGLYYYGARYYAPWSCRFVSVDPLAGKYPFYTPYQYAGNKPINFIDLDGLEEWAGPMNQLFLRTVLAMDEADQNYQLVLYTRNIKSLGSNGSGENPEYIYFYQNKEGDIEQKNFFNHNHNNQLAKNYFQHYLPDRFLTHYEMGDGNVYYLTRTEMVDLAATPVGIESGDFKRQLDQQTSGMKVGDKVEVCLSASNSISRVGGGLGQFTVNVHGIYTKTESGFEFEGEMAFSDMWDFDLQSKEGVEARANETGISRSSTGSFQTFLGHFLLSGSGFEVKSPNVPVKQSSNMPFFDWFYQNKGVPYLNTLSKETK